MRTKISLEEVADFFDEVADDRIALFDYQKRDGTKLSIKDFFKAYFHGRICRYNREDDVTARAMFHLIFEDNKFVLSKLANELDCLKELGNIEKNWRDVVTSTTNQIGDGSSSNSFNAEDKNTDRRGITTGDLTGVVDASQFSKVKSLQANTTPEVGKPLNFLDPSTRNRSQLIHYETGENVITLTQMNRAQSTNRSTMAITSSTSSSNASRDYYQFLNLRLPEIRRDFLSAFEVLFYF